MRKQLLSLALLLSIPAFAVGDKVSPDLKRKNADELVNVIIQYRHPPQHEHKQKIAAQGGHANLEVLLVNGIVARIPAGALRSLERDPEVIYISPDRPVKAHLNYVAA